MSLESSDQKKAMPLYHPKYREDARGVKAEVMAVIVHAFLKRVRTYSQETIDKKWNQLKEKKGDDPDALQKYLHWVHYHRFNEIALKEIEDGTLDTWFKNLLK